MKRKVKMENFKTSRKLHKQEATVTISLSPAWQLSPCSAMQEFLGPDREGRMSLPHMPVGKSYSAGGQLWDVSSHEAYLCEQSQL